ncbi:MAG: CRISPR-associated endonuclease Cas3'', partial [Clostridiales Family XIII bacterium]|nr:CRISPR-associated endonuclease Cas3'' [Clostridiales Family XIII bacterium]
MKPIYYAHSKGSDKKDWERLIVHLRNVAARCKTFSEAFGCGVLGEFAGLLHDIGKYASEFVLRLEGKAVKIDHSTAGAIAADKHISVRLLARMIQYVIAGHHGGLPNFHPLNEAGSLRGRLLKTVNDYSAYQTEVVFP